MPGRRGAAAALLAACLALCSFMQPSSAHGTVGEALLFNVVDNVGNFISAGGNLVTSLVKPAATKEVRLPACAPTHVLRAAGGFPQDWAALTAEEQAAHPINLIIMQLAYSVYQPPTALAKCLKDMGVDSILPVTMDVPGYLTTTTAHVLKAGNESIFVLFKGSDLTTWVQNLECGQKRVGAWFGAGGADVRVHTGFFEGWRALEPEVLAAVQEFLQEVPSGKVYLVGHSLGGALASIAALRLSRILPKPAEVAGVWLLASPRAGNPTWRSLYNAVLLQRTLRITNYLDAAARLPKQQEACAVAGASVINLLAPTQQYAYAHVGRSLLMCPTRDGLTHWDVAPAGSEVVACPGTADDADATFATHLLGSYFDAWRRGHVAARNASLADDPRLAAVLCDECTVRRPTPLMQIAAPARAGGPVTCMGVDASCSSRLAWDAATAVGQTSSLDHVGHDTICNGYMCA